MSFWEGFMKRAADEKKKNWVAFDLDGTLAFYDGYQGDEHIGEPIPAMMAKLKKYLKKGDTVKIFTARAANPEAIPHVKAWLKKHGLPELEVTNQKDHGMWRLYDDRAVHVVKNTGMPCCEKYKEKL